jgi:hypothetical protein
MKLEHVRDYEWYDSAHHQPEAVWATDWLWHSSVERCPSQHHHKCVITTTASKQFIVIRRNGPNCNIPPQQAAGTSKMCQNGYWQTDNRNQQKQCNRQETPVLTARVTVTWAQHLADKTHWNSRDIAWRLRNEHEKSLCIWPTYTVNSLIGQP